MPSSANPIISTKSFTTNHEQGSQPICILSKCKETPQTIQQYSSHSLWGTLPPTAPIQLPRYENVKHDTRLSKGFHITNMFDTGLKTHEQRRCPKFMSRLSTQDKHTSWYRILKPNWIYFEPNHKELGMFSQATLKHPLKDGLTLLRGECAFVIEFEGGERVIIKLKRTLG